jgi:hypothetical protein
VIRDVKRSKIRQSSSANHLHDIVVTQFRIRGQWHVDEIMAWDLALLVTARVLSDHGGSFRNRISEGLPTILEFASKWSDDEIESRTLTAVSAPHDLDDD